MEPPPLNDFLRRVGEVVRSKRRVRLPELGRVEHAPGETHEVLVRVASPIGDHTLLTVERLDDPQVTETFTTRGRVEEGTRGRIRWADAYRALAGWRFEPEASCVE